MRKVLLSLAMVLFCGQSAFASWAKQQDWALSSDGGAAPTLTFTYASSVTSGTMLICTTGFAVLTTEAVSGVQDGVNNVAWTQLPSPASPIAETNQGRTTATWYYLNSAAGTPTVTVTYNGLTLARNMVCGAYSGLATISAADVSTGQPQINPGTSADAVTSGTSASTAQANSLAITISYANEASLTFAVSASGYTSQLASTSSSSATWAVGDKNIASAGSTTAGTFTVSSASADTNTLVAVFKEPAATARPSTLMTMGVGD